MKKAKRGIILIINVMAIAFFVVSLAVPAGRKTVKYSDTDISAYNGRGSVPRVGAITNQRDMEIAFSLYNEKLYGISLFFSAEGEVRDGEILCTLQYDDQDLENITIPVKELFALMKGTTINAKEIIFTSKPDASGRYTLLLQGNGIDPGTRISLYGTQQTRHLASYNGSGDGNFYDVIYMIETVTSKHPYIWASSLILVLCLLISMIIHVSDEDYSVESKDKC